MARVDFEHIYLVTGLPRSGTSLMMKMLEAGGMPLLVDNIREADDDNPKGYYELEEVKQLKDGDHDWLSKAGGKTVKIVAPLLRYLPTHFTYKAIFMRRALPEILASQKQMLLRRGKDPKGAPDEMMTKVFEKQVIDVLDWIKTNSFISNLEVSYSGLIANAMPIIEEIQEFLSNDLDIENMTKVVDPDLYRQRAG